MKKAPTLSINERFILQYIIDITSKGKSFYRCDKSLGSILEVNERTIQRMISKLVTNGYIIKSKTDSGNILLYTGKEYDKLPIYSNYRAIKTNVAEEKSKSLKEHNKAISVQNSMLLKRVNDLVDENKHLKDVIKHIQQERDNMIITIEDLNREIQALK